MRLALTIVVNEALHHRFGEGVTCCEVFRSDCKDTECVRQIEDKLLKFERERHTSCPGLIGLVRTITGVVVIFMIVMMGRVVTRYADLNTFERSAIELRGIRLDVF